MASYLDWMSEESLAELLAHGFVTSAVMPDGNDVIYADSSYGLTNGDFESHLISAVIHRIANLNAHHVHKRLLEADPRYAERYREAVLAKRRKGKAGKAATSPASDAHPGDDEYAAKG